MFFGGLSLLIGWKFNIAGVNGSAAHAAAAALGVSVALIARFSIRCGVRDWRIRTESSRGRFSPMPVHAVTTSRLVSDKDQDFVDFPAR